MYFFHIRFHSYLRIFYMDVSDLVVLLCLLPWINHLPRVCWSIFGNTVCVFLMGISEIYIYIYTYICFLVLEDYFSKYHYLSFAVYYSPEGKYLLPQVPVACIDIYRKCSIYSPLFDLHFNYKRCFQTGIYIIIYMTQSELHMCRYRTE